MLGSIKSRLDKIDTINLARRIKLSNRYSTNYGIIIFLVFIFFSFLSLYLLKTNIINNSTVLGFNKVEDFNARAQGILEHNINTLNLISFYSNLKIQKHKKVIEPEIIQQLEDLSNSQDELFKYQFYVYTNNHYVHGIADTLLPSTRRMLNEAVLQARKQKNQVVFMPHNRQFSNNGGFLLATTINEDNDVVILDLDPSRNLGQENPLMIAKDTHNYYLIDDHGNLIYYATNLNVDFQPIQEYIYDNFNKFTDACDNDDETRQPIHLKGFNHNEIVAYVVKNKNTGWYSIAVIPYNDIIKDYSTITNIFIFLVLFLLATQLIMLLRERHLSTRMEVTNEALKIVGNSYQAIIRVNFKKGYFEILKAPDSLRNKLADKNEFRELKRYFKSVIHPDHLESFIDDYSISNMEHLAVNHIRDMGHDYLIKFHKDRYKWYNVRILFDESLDLDESILSFKLVDDDKIRENTEKKLLKTALQAAKQNEESKQAFYSSMSHDMRTPLNGIIGICSLARTHLDNPQKINEMLDKIFFSSQNLLHLVDEILEVAKPNIEHNLDLEVCNLKEQLEEDLSVFAFTANQEHKKFKYNINIKHQIVKCDCKKIKQILNNLISNSFKYSNYDADIQCTVNEMKVMNNYQYVFKVQDNGIGMSQDFLTKIYEPYTREGSKPSAVGTGLGMSIVKNLISLMSGDIKIKSEQNIGTTVTVILPLQPTNEDVASTTEMENKNIINSNFDIKGLKILLAEDNQLNMEIATELLQIRGAIITQAWNGQEAVDIFNKSDNNYFDVILMDIKMPILDGCQAAFKIRQLKRKDATTIPIIAVTANAFSEDISATIAAGMNAHISKPIDFNILMDTLERLVKQGEE